MKFDWFPKVVVRGGIARKDGCGTPYRRIVTERLWKQGEFYIKDDITFRPEYGIDLSKDYAATMPTKYYETFFIESKKTIMRSRDSGNVWLINCD